MSMESQTLEIDGKPPGSGLRGQQRDSESEDLNIPQQRSNFHQNAFFFNIHQFMKENVENLKTHVIKDMLSNPGGGPLSKKKESLAARSQILTHEDVEQYIENLITDQFKEEITQERPNDQDGEGQSSLLEPKPGVKSNISKIVGILDIAMTEVLCSKATSQLRRASSERQLSKFKIITQIPNFRLGLITKIVQMMKAEMRALEEHISKNRADLDKEAHQPKKMEVF